MRAHWAVGHTGLCAGANCGSRGDVLLRRVCSSDVLLCERVVSEGMGWILISLRLVPRSELKQAVSLGEENDLSSLVMLARP